MTRGLYRTGLGSVMVENNDEEAPLTWDRYVTAGYEPSLDVLPTQEQYYFGMLHAGTVALDDKIRQFRETHRPEGLRNVWKRLGLN